MIRTVYIFAADIHLRPDNRDDMRRFCDWLDRVSPVARQVYLLGDVFDYWYTGMEDTFSAALTALARENVSILPGNRDFLLFDRAPSGLHILPAEEVAIDIHGSRVLLAHGHTLISNNPGFTLLHHLGWPLLRLVDRYLNVPAKDRIARSMLSSSQTLRVSHATIPASRARERHADTIICGHLHRPIMQPGLIVLPPFEQGWLTWDETGPHFAR